MHFRHVPPRINWREDFAKLGYSIDLLDSPPYWIEAIENPFCAVFDLEEVALISEATLQINELALSLVENVCFGKRSEELFDFLKVPPHFRQSIRTSWRRNDFSLMGRLDFAYSEGQIKLLELNYDTPLSLYETASLQLHWLRENLLLSQIPDDANQFNGIHQGLVDEFRKHFAIDDVLYFSCFQKEIEQLQNVKYVQSRAEIAGLQTKFVYLNDLQCESEQVLLDADGFMIKNLSKLVPWDFLMVEEDTLVTKMFTHLTHTGQVRFLEPFWKCILSNKVTLALLWQLAPENKYLLETYIDDDSSEALKLRQQAHVRKPIYGRQGQNISLIFPDNAAQNEHNGGAFGDEGYILQAFHQLPKYNEYHLVIGSWVIGRTPSAVGVRADKNKITANEALFVPHYVSTSN